MTENTHTNFILDKDIPKPQWSQYLKKYEDKYQMFLDADGDWAIKCSRGKIGVNSILKKKLFFTTVDLPKKATTFFLRKIRSQAEEMVEIIQDGDYGFTIRFDEENLPLVAKITAAIRKMNLSPEERARRASQMKINLKKPIQQTENV